MIVPDTTPVLVGVGTATQRLDDPGAAREPVGLMADALRAAGADSGAEALLERVDWLLVPKGRWRYGDPARLVADRVGAKGARTVLAQIGVLQTTLTGRACARIAAGEIEVAAVVGGEAGHRLRTAAKAGVTAAETADDGTPDEVWRPADELFHPAEQAAGFRDAMGLYSLLDSAWRHAAGHTPDQARDAMARRYARFSEIAAGNPDAWTRQPLSAAEVREPGPPNPMLAFPYTRSVITSWSVDQAGALLLCSAAVARELGVPESRWVFPVADAESNHMEPVCARADLARCVGAGVAGAAVLGHAGLAADELDLVELYSCFPVAVEAYAREIGVDPERDLTVTGGMSFAGGPLNNYALQAVCRAAMLLRADPDARTALVTAVSGLLTKQGVSLWSTGPPSRPFAHLDVTDEVAGRADPREAVERLTGRGTVVASTVLFGRDSARVVLLVEQGDRTRGFAVSQRPELVAALQAEDWVGREVEVVDSQLV